MLVVVSDTSPIRALGHLGLIGILGDLYADILVPPEVASELRNSPSPRFAVDIGGFPFIRVQAPTDPAQVERLARTLDPGESEALALALEVHADLVLIDESAGRAAARRLGLVPVGVLGTLIRAKQRGLLVEVSPLIDRLEDELRFFISPEVRSEVLRAAGEST